MEVRDKHACFGNCHTLNSNRTLTFATNNCFCHFLAVACKSFNRFVWEVNKLWFQIFGENLYLSKVTYIWLVLINQTNNYITSSACSGNCHTWTVTEHWHLQLRIVFAIFLLLRAKVCLRGQPIMVSYFLG